MEGGKRRHFRCPRNNMSKGTEAGVQKQLCTVGTHPAGGKGVEFIF